MHPRRGLERDVMNSIDSGVLIGCVPMRCLALASYIRGLGGRSWFFGQVREAFRGREYATKGSEPRIGHVVKIRFSVPQVARRVGSWAPRWLSFVNSMDERENRLLLV
jgi:hypothetical protein